MDDVWARAALVAGALAVAGVVVLVQRWRAARPRRTSGPTGLAPGLYFFSSSDCETCLQARETLDARLGTDAYTEIEWQERGDVFERVGVDAVPAMVIVSADGRGSIYPGQPERALDAWNS